MEFTSIEKNGDAGIAPEPEPVKITVNVAFAVIVNVQGSADVELPVQTLAPSVPLDMLAVDPPVGVAVTVMIPAVVNVAEHVPPPEVHPVILPSAVATEPVPEPMTVTVKVEFVLVIGEPN